MPTPAKGQIGLVLENLTTPGLASRLPATSVGATMSRTTQPSGSSGMRLLIYVYGHTASGTITIAGKDITGTPQTEPVTNVPAQTPALPTVFSPKFDIVTAE